MRTFNSPWKFMMDICSIIQPFNISKFIKDHWRLELRSLVLRLFYICVTDYHDTFFSRSFTVLYYFWKVTRYYRRSLFSLFLTFKLHFMANLKSSSKAFRISCGARSSIWLQSRVVKSTCGWNATIDERADHTNSQLSNCHQWNSTAIDKNSPSKASIFSAEGNCETSRRSMLDEDRDDHLRRFESRNDYHLKVIITRGSSACRLKVTTIVDNTHQSCPRTNKGLNAVEELTSMIEDKILRMDSRLKPSVCTDASKLDKRANRNSISDLADRMRIHESAASEWKLATPACHGSSVGAFRRTYTFVNWKKCT